MGNVVSMLACMLILVLKLEMLFFSLHVGKLARSPKIFKSSPFLQKITFFAFVHDGVGAFMLEGNVSIQVCHPLFQL